VRAGEVLPEVRWDAAKQSASLHYPGQSDSLDFKISQDHRTLFTARRGDLILIR